MTPEIGAVVQRALDAAVDRLHKEGAHAARAEGLAEEVTPAQRRADALGRLAECALAADLDHGTSGDRYQVILHVDSATVPSTPAPDAGQAVMESGEGATHLSAETSRRIACDASLVVMQHAPDGSVLDVGRKRRTIPATIRRALLARDRSCQFPGCTARRCDGHHIRHWADGGPTTLHNLTLLCRRHHRAVHEEGFVVIRGDDGGLTFHRPDGTRVEHAPAMPQCNNDDGALWPATTRLDAAPCWDSTPLNVGWAIDILRRDSRHAGDG